MNDQQLCEIVHKATASSLYPNGTHSGETMAVAKAVREACAKICDERAKDRGSFTGQETLAERKLDYEAEAALLAAAKAIREN